MFAIITCASTIVLIAREQGVRLVIEKQESIKQSLKDRFKKVAKDRSLADELITERREAAKDQEIKLAVKRSKEIEYENYRRRL